MKILVQSTHEAQLPAIASELRRQEPSWEYVLWPSDAPCAYAIAWRPPAELFARQPALRAVIHFGAGVDAVLAEDVVPANLPIVRLEDAGMAQPIAEYALHAVIHHHRGMDRYREQQREGLWQPHPITAPLRPVVGIMGLGQLGRVAASSIARFGYPVRGWSRTKKTLADVETFAGRAELTAFLSRCEVLVAILPLTPETRGVLDHAAFAALPRGAYVVNLGRGAHVVDADLLAAIDRGHLAGATLDVFSHEPLAKDHPYWTHPKVRVTPHIGATTPTREACAQAIAKIRALESGQSVTGIVDRVLGY